MVYYAIVRDVAGPVDGYKAGRTLLVDMAQTCPDRDRAIVARYNRYGCPPGVCYHVIGQRSDAPPAERLVFDHIERSRVTGERILVS